MSADKLSSRSIPCEVTFDESVPFYRLFPYRSAPLPPPSVFLAPGPPPVDPLPPQGPAPSGVSQVDPVKLVEIAVDSGATGCGATRGAEPAGAGPGGTVPACMEPGVAESEGAEPRGAEPERAEPGGAELGGAEPGCAEPGGAEPERTQPGGTLCTGGPSGALSRRQPLSPPQLREWFAWRTRLRSGAAGARGAAGVGARGTGAGAAGGTGATGPGGARNRAAGGTGAGAGRGTGAAGPRGARTGSTGPAGAGGAAGVGAGDPGAGGNGPGGAGAVGARVGDTGRPRPFFVPLLQQASHSGSSSSSSGSSSGNTSSSSSRSSAGMAVRLGRVARLGRAARLGWAARLGSWWRGAGGRRGRAARLGGAARLGWAARVLTKGGCRAGPQLAVRLGPQVGRQQSRAATWRRSSRAATRAAEGQGLMRRRQHRAATGRRQGRAAAGGKVGAATRGGRCREKEQAVGNGGCDWSGGGYSKGGLTETKKTTPTLRWMGKVGDASVFRVWGSRAFVRYNSADKLSSRAVPCGPAPSGVSQVDLVEPVEVAVDSGAARGAESKGAEPGGAEAERVEPGGPPRVSSRREPLSLQWLREWYARRCSRAAGATRPTAGGAYGAGAAGGTAGAGVARAAGPGGAGVAGPGGARTGGTGGAGAGGAAGVGAIGGGAVATRGAARARAAGGTGAGGAAGVVAGDPGAEGTGAVSAVSGGAARPRPYYVPLLQQVLGLQPSTGPTPPLLSPPLVQSQSQLQPASPLPGPFPYSGLTRGLKERREPESRRASPESRPASPESRPESPVCTVCTGRRVPRQRPPPVPGTHYMTLHPSTAPQRAPLPSPPASSLPDGPDPESDSLRAASPTVTRFLATIVTDPSFESTAACALVAELVDFAAACRLDYAASLVVDSESASVCPPSVGAMDTEMASWKSTSTYVDKVPPLGANIITTLRVPLRVAAQRDYELHSLDFSTPFLQGSLHKEIWLRRPPGFTGSFLAGTQWSLRRPVYGLRQPPCEWHDTLRMTLAALGFGPSTADPSLFLRTDTTMPPFYVLVYVDDLVFATADTESTPLPTDHSLSAPPLDESVEPSGPYLELVGCLMYLMTCTRPDLAYPLSILARYVAPGRHRSEHMDAANRVLRYLCSTSGMGLVLGGRAQVVLTGHSDASWADDLTTQRSSQGYTFSLRSGSVSWRSTRSSSVLSSSCEAEIYAGAMAAQELRWLTYLLTDLGEPPRSPPVLYVDNKAMIDLCQEHRLEHRTKHIALRYFLARELQLRGQLRLPYVASRANTADVFTKALQPCDHQRFCTVLGLVPTVPHLLTS
ncbi:unnamed protein product [Closterium sp. NIES-54]